MIWQLTSMPFFFKINKTVWAMWQFFGTATRVFVFILSILRYLITEWKHIWWTWKNMAWDLKKVFHLITPLLYSTPCIEMYKLQNTITVLSEIILFLSYQKCYICNKRYNLGNEKCFSGSRSIDRNKYTVLTRKTQGKDNKARSWKKALIIRKYFYAFRISIDLVVCFFKFTWCISSHNL